MKSLTLSTAALIITCLSLAQIPGTLSYQGILVDAGGAPVTDGNHTVTFSFFTGATGGIAVFSRGPFTVTTYKGMFTFVIGTGTPAGNTVLPTITSDPNYIGASQYYVEVVADGVTLSPRVQLSSVPYAFQAQNVSNVGITSSPNKVAVGVNSGIANTTGDQNTFVGNEAGKFNTTASTNSFFGYRAGSLTTTGSFNTSVGTEALYSNTTGINNSATGKDALRSNTTGLNNSAFGLRSLFSNTIGDLNTAVGVEALSSNVAGSGATAVGHNAMQFANSTSTPFTNTNVAVGYEALRGSTSASSNIGIDNTAIGYQALQANSSGSLNTAIGSEGLLNNTTGTQNVAIGVGTLKQNTTGIRNVAIGLDALNVQTSSMANTAIGWSAGQLTTGNNNTAFGYQALSSNTSGSNNTALGYAAGVAAANLSNATAIGANAVVGASNSMVLGGTGANAVKVGIGITIPTTDLHLSHGNVGPASGHGLTLQNNAGTQTWSMWVSNATGNLNLYQENNFIGGFDDSNGNYTPVSDLRLKKNISSTEEVLPSLMKVNVKRYHFKTQSDEELKNIGVIAQELMEIYPELVKHNPDGDRYTVDYMSMAPLAIKAIQEQQLMINKLKQRIEQLDNVIETERNKSQELNDKLEAISAEMKYLMGALKLDKSASSNSEN